MVGEPAKTPIFVHRQAVGIRSNPEAAVAILRKAGEYARRDAVLGAEAARELAVCVVVQAADRCANPDDAAVVFEQTADVGIGEAFLRSEMFHPVAAPSEQ